MLLPRGYLDVAAIAHGRYIGDTRIAGFAGRITGRCHRYTVGPGLGIAHAANCTSREHWSIGIIEGSRWPRGQREDLPVAPFYPTLRSNINLRSTEHGVSEILIVGRYFGSS